ncbi:methylmalonyl-CoA mutase, N-terminal domain/subunit [Belliella baltica DSM 15883]|uniref:Methylmalonyl-CoA mutase, N-terminal domain/subunit n=1 Tax=Belliella baltica (strain DSM 15883 / CIP 108006 / LMG 21964 / BA134) TaxID=866536 RepID=I3ZAT2_BELBD|nr:methylmalonyl-CoA mutase family protein [Belliella baltica]AFL86350.1 methylmalonyl-CoA mutase, N-terminal domain/subunit [Belliella baltica DSM 15883]
MKNKLFEDFQPTNKEEWIAQAIKDLKGKSFDEMLVSQSLEGIQIAPFYTQEDLLDQPSLAGFHHKVNPKPLISGIAPRVWSNATRIESKSEKEGNAIILNALQNGSDAIILILNGEENLSILLKDVQPAYIQIFLEPTSSPTKVLANFKSWLRQENHDYEQVYGGVLWDGFIKRLTEDLDKEEVIQISRKLLDFGYDLPNFKTITIDFSHYHNAGANAVQELTFGFSALIDLIDDLSVDQQMVFDKLILKTAVGSDYFMEIAKVKVIRILTQRLAALFQVNQKAEDIFIFSSTSYWTKSGVDIQTNMLRNTTEAMSAILGGCNALEVLRHDCVNNDVTEFSLRMARNISNILKEESYLDQVLDPFAGSYFLEKLTFSIFEKVKDKMVSTESSGGWWNSVNQNLIQEEVKKTRIERQKMVLVGKQVKVGVNKYLDSSSKTAQIEISINEESASQLKTSRESFLVETQKSSVI